MMQRKRSAQTGMGAALAISQRAQTMLRDFDRLRRAIRAEGTPAVQDAWDKCERWVGCIDPNGEREK